MGPFVSSKVHMRSYALKWVDMGPYRSLCDLIDSNGSLFVIRIPYVSLWDLMHFYKSLCVVIGTYGSLTVFMDIDEF